MNDLDVPKGSQPPSRRRFYIGSAAIFWFVVALLIWGTLFYLSLLFRKDGDWFLASYSSAPALLAALLAVLIRNLSYNGVLAWLITPPVWVFVSYIMLHKLFT
jgi:hypothetical protein